LNPDRALICAIGLWAALGVMNASAQTGNAGAAPPASSVTAASDANAARAADRALRKTVIRQLSRTRGLDVEGINVTARSGVVTLLGIVPDAQQIALAQDVAGCIAGVREVRNSLTLQANGK
jgi:hyperosmotically inducible periplasmic protein